MSPIPSIRGVIIALEVEAVGKLLASGRVSRRELERRLTEADLALLDEPVDPNAWYDIRINERFLRLLAALEGDGDQNEMLARVGADEADRLLEASPFKQLDYLQFIHQKPESRDASPEAARLARRSDLRLIASLGERVYNFGRWEVQPDPEHADRFQVEGRELDALPDALCWAIEGFVNRLAAVYTGPGLWRHSRPTRDRVVFRMTRPA